MSARRDAIADLLVDYAWLLDNDKLEEWVELFTEDARYDIIPRENFDRGLPLCLASCRNKAMIRDRILALRVANEYNIHFDRHVISPARVTGEDEKGIRIEANYIIAQTDQGGNTRLFSAGSYRMLLSEVDGRLRIRDLVVVVDTFCVPTLIATPI